MAGLLFAFGIWADLGALMVALFVIIAGIGFHRFWTITDPEQRQFQSLLFFRNVTILGAALAFFGFFSGLGHTLGLTLTGPLFHLR